MKQKITISYLERLKKEGYIRDYIIKEGAENNSPNLRKKGKYGNKRVQFDGLWFDSKAEAKYYGLLKYRLLAGEIRELKTQQSFELNDGGTHSLKYIADYTWIETATGEYVVADKKGFKTKIYLKKKRLMLKVWGLTIKEV